MLRNSARPRRRSRNPLPGLALLAMAVALIAATLFVGQGVVKAIWAAAGPAGTPTPTAPPTPTPTPEPLAACSIGDVSARHAAYTDWSRTLVDTSFTLGESYAPTDLVPVAEAGIGGSGTIRSLVVDDLRAMTSAAEAAGLHPKVNSAYRSYDDQAKTFNDLRSKYGLEYAQNTAARPGHSEHQLGTAIDFGGAVGAWLAVHAWEYGFIGSYPADSSPKLTCYQAEAWHYRYFGREIAAAIHDSGMPAREWLWYNAG